jgi:uncharacterized protein YqcC (DUF446 family)
MKSKAPTATSVAERLAVVKVKMQEAGVWDTPPPPAEAFENMGAFGMNTMPFTDWLRWVFVPNVEGLLASGGPFPKSSQVAAQAMREGDTDPVVHSLVAALDDFDRLFG